jgi:hypothetical protein
MTRSERLAREGLVEVYAGEIITARVITPDEMSKNAARLRYIGTDYETRYNGRDVWANIYEDENGDILATIEN